MERQMDSLRVIEHSGKQVVVLDFANAADPLHLLDHVAAAEAWFGRQPPTRSLRVLTDLTGSAYNSVVLEALKRLSAHNRPFVGASAVVLSSALGRFAATSTALLAGRTFATFTNRQSALDWLAEQPLDSASG
jgi:hypothetical protein